MATPQKSCDLVMKGGITSGVVYPMAVVELAREYRFDNIGGTSAGAIAAVITAAAEFGREEGGFDKVAKLPDDLSKNLLEKFQPTPKLKPLFDLLIASMEGGKTRLPLALLGGYRGARCSARHLGRRSSCWRCSAARPALRCSGCWCC
jgi:predicted acylesterase/phospholipase RssA